MEAAAKSFFCSTSFAVAGASQASHKFGYKVLTWYHARSLPVQPLTPSWPTISVPGAIYSAISSPLELLHPMQTSLSIVTSPSVTRQVLKEAKEAGVRAIWLQPGSFDSEGLEYAMKEFKTAVGGEGGRGGEGWCLLVDGDQALKAAREDGNLEKL